MPADLLAELRRELALDDLGRALERGVEGAAEPVELTGIKRRDAPLRMQLRRPKDLVGVGVADARDELVIHEQVAQLAARRLRALRELICGPRQGAGLDALVGVAGHSAVLRARRQQIHLPHPRVVAIPQVHIVIECECEGGRGADLRRGREQIEEPGEHRVHDDARSIVEREREETPAMRDRHERSSFQCLVERPRRAQHERVVNADRSHMAADDGLVDPRPQDVQIRPFGHCVSSRR